MAPGVTNGDGPSDRLGITVFSGGTAANSLVDVFNRIAEKRRCKLNYVIPISDNGGSSSELIRFIGGPSVGDIRSRLVRLIPNQEDDREMSALKLLFEHRLDSDPLKAREEWQDIVESRSLLWSFISSPKRELIRSVLNTVNLEIVKRARPPNVFDFASASVGNMFLTGARLFTGSFESAIYLLSMICSIPPSISVLPVINSNFAHHICAGLADGTIIAGQNAISHPSAPTAVPGDSTTTHHHLLHNIPTLALHKQVLLSQAQAQACSHSPHTTSSPTPNTFTDFTEDDDDEEDGANLPGSLPALRRPNIAFSKHHSADDEEDLPARIERLWYINPYGQEIAPVANPKVVEALAQSRVVVYSIGSLYTSIIPSLVLRAVGRAIAFSDLLPGTASPVPGRLGTGTPVGGDPGRSPALEALSHPPSSHGGGERGIRHKILILNSRIDRETGPRTNPMSAKDFVAAIARACVESRAPELVGKEEVLRRCVTHLIYVDREDLVPAKEEDGVSNKEGDGDEGYEEEMPLMPKVEVEELERLGITCVKVRGRKEIVARRGKRRVVVLRYDEQALGVALERIIES